MGREHLIHREQRFVAFVLPLSEVHPQSTLQTIGPREFLRSRLQVLKHTRLPREPFFLVRSLPFVRILQVIEAPQSRLTRRFTCAQNPLSWAGSKSHESRASRKGSCVLQFRTPDAPEMRLCQTKSFLGNLVCFKTCNLDLRNSLKIRK